MKNVSEKIVIDYFSDVLCVWAWIAQARLDELETQWQDKITVRHHFVDIFGDCQQKISKNWGEENGYEKFGQHVAHSAAPFEQASVNPRVWLETRPLSSAQAHLFLRAVALTEGESRLGEVSLRLRSAFFYDALDISNMDVLLELAAQCGCNLPDIEQSIRNGSAIAAYSSDLRKANDLGVRGSPTWILNSGRQVLYGNVGYRILNANIEELLKHPEDEASWC